MSKRNRELQLVEYFRQMVGREPQRVPIGIGDDMAAVRSEGDLVLVTCDMLLDGTHFDTARHSMRQIGRKAMACSLSDCAAMACRPVAATVAVALNHDAADEDARQLFAGLKSMAEEFDCAIVGGDTTAWPHPLVIDVSMLAEPATPRSPVRRNGARLDDEVYVTGELGGSLSGKHLRFVPRVREAVALAETLGDRLHAMMDLSDGLSLDLHRMCRASRAGATLDEDRLTAVISEAARSAAEGDDLSPLEHALHDGEDFELLFVVESGAVPPELGVRCTRIGLVTSGGLTIRSSDGRTSVLEPRGYEHLR
jgi:thiamine-monophosphate kinase